MVFQATLAASDSPEGGKTNKYFYILTLAFRKID